MIIQGAHLNQAYMQQVAAKQGQNGPFGSRRVGAEDHPGLHLGQSMRLNPAKAGLTPAAEALANAPGQVKKASDDLPDTIGKAFANEIIRRMGEQTGEDGEVKDSTNLRHSLGSTMDWIRERFGDETAAAAAGMIVQSTSSGVNEDTLGNGLLNTLKFIDRNFGIAAGDEAIAQFNSGINQAVNDFFDNGKNELFFAVETPAGGPTASQDLHARFISQALPVNENDEDEVSLTEKLLQDIEDELKKIGELQDLTQKLEEEFNPAQANTKTALAAYQTTPEFNEPQLASLNV